MQCIDHTLIGNGRQQKEKILVIFLPSDPSSKIKSYGFPFYCQIDENKVKSDGSVNLVIGDTKSWLLHKVELAYFLICENACILWMERCIGTFSCKIQLNFIAMLFKERFTYAINIDHVPLRIGEANCENLLFSVVEENIKILESWLRS